MEENRYSINSMRTMEIINITSGSRMGYLRDIKINCEESKVEALILQGESKGWFGKSDDIEIPWDKIYKIGLDVILVEMEEVLHSQI